MRTLRLFVSSPGDVSEERIRAKQVIEQLRRRYVNHFYLKPVIWEDLPLEANLSFQQGIDLMLSDEHGIDVAIFILWARLGTPLGPPPKKDGTQYRSGTEREFELLLEARRKAGGKWPAILVYSRHDENSFEERLRGKPTKEKCELISQKKLAEEFIAEEFRDAHTGVNLRAHHKFDQPVTFSNRLRVHLTELLDELAGGEFPHAVWNADTQGAPFQGLEAFQEEHADVFCGRESEILDARFALRQQACNGCAFLMLVGASGSGKSSLARAGVMPAVVANEMDEQISYWRTIATTPLALGADALSGLVHLFADNRVIPELRGPTGDSLTDIIESLRNAPNVTRQLLLKDAFTRASARLNGGLKVLLLLDQMEEMFSASSPQESERANFVGFLEALARSGYVWVLATIRSDYYSHVLTQPVLIRMIGSQGSMLLSAPGADALRRIIVEPAQLCGLVFERRNGQSLSDRILADAASRSELLPMLEYLLREIYESRTEQNLLTWDAYLALGGVEGALGKRAEDVFLALPVEAQQALDRVLRALVTIGQRQGDCAVESFVRHREPLTSFDQDANAKLLVQIFVRERLFTTTSDSVTGEPVVAVTHECLLRVWSRAVTWSHYNIDFLRTRTRLLARVAEGSPLLEGDPLLEIAHGYLRRDGNAFAESLRTFVHKSLNTATAGRRRREQVRNRVMASLAALSLLAITAAIFAFRQSAVADQQKVFAQANEIEAKRYAHQVLVEKQNQDKLLLTASKADHESSLRALDSGKRVESLAYISRSLDLYPGNTAALMASVFMCQTAVGNLLAVRNILTYEGFVNHCVFSQDSTFIAISSLDGTISIHDVNLDGERCRIKIHGAADTLSISPDGRTLAVGSEEEEHLQFFTSDTGELIIRVAFKGAVHSIDYSPDGSKVVVATSDKTTRVVELENGLEICKTDFGSELWSVKFLPGGKSFIVGSEDATARIVDAQTGRELRKIAFPEPVHSVSPSPDGKWLVVGGDSGTCKMFSSSGTNKSAVGTYTFPYGIESIKFSPDSRWFTACGEGRDLIVIETTTGKELSRIAFGDVVSEADFSPDGRWVAGCSRDGTLRIVEAENGKELARAEFFDFLYSLDFSNDGRWLVAGGRDKTVRIFETGINTHYLDIPVGQGAHSLSFSPDERFLAIAGSKDATFSLAINSWGESSTSKGDKPFVKVNFTSDSQCYAAVKEEGKTIEFLTAARSDYTRKIGFKHAVSAMQISPDGETMAVGDETGSLFVLDIETAKNLWTFECENMAFNLCFSDDGRLLACGDDNKCKVFDANTGKQLHTFACDDHVSSACFSSDGKLLIFGGYGTTVPVIDLASGKEIYHLTTPTKRNLCAICSAGSLLAVGDDRNVRIFDLGTGSELCSYHLNEEPINDVVFSKNGTWLAIGGDLGTVRLVDCRWFLREDRIGTTAWKHFLEFQAGYKFGDSNRLQPLSGRDFDALSNFFKEETKEKDFKDAEGQMKVLKWRKTSPDMRSISPWDSTSIDDYYFDYWLQQSPSRQVFLQFADAAPWHPLQPLLVALIEVDEAISPKTSSVERIRFLVNLTIKRIREANRRQYDEKTLAAYKDFLVSWVEKLEMPELLSTAKRL